MKSSVRRKARPAQEAPALFAPERRSWENRRKRQDAEYLSMLRKERRQARERRRQMSGLVGLD